MPFGAIPVIGAGAGVAASVQDQQQQQIQQQELLANLLMHAQSVAAQREWNENYKQAQLASLNQNRAALQQDAAERAQTGRMSLIRQQAEDLPGGTNISGPEFQRIQQAGSGNLFTFKPGQLEGTQIGGQSVGPSTTGGATTGETPAQDTQTQAAKNLQFTKIPSVKEQEFETTRAATQAQRDVVNALAQARFEDTSGQGWQKIADAVTRAQAAAGKQGWTVQQGQDPTTGKPMWIRVNKDTGEVKPVDVGELNVGPKQNATTDTRLKSASSVLKTGNDIINQVSDPKIAAQLGPAMSRYNNLLDFIGNPPPEFAKLAGNIESYALANMGVHGMRSASGAEAIKQTIGLGRHTPESLRAVIEGLNGFAQHFMEDQGMTVPKPAPRSSGGARDLGKDW